MSSNDVSTPPPLQTLPTSRERKYDRQLRLWAAAGQAALEEAHVLCINAGTGVTGVEALKNLVLPGVGQFTIHDSAIVTEADLGVNFFLDKQSLGTYRADGSARLLQELNPDVKAHVVTEPFTTWLAQPDVLNPFTLLIVTSPIKADLLAIVTQHARQSGAPLIHVQSVGFRSVISLSLPSAFPIVDTHPDPETTIDLRLADPWPELSDLTTQKTGNLAALSAEELAHVPYLLLLLHFLDQWRATHEGQMPKNSKEKTAFKQMISQASPPNEENFEEACNAVLRTVKPSTVPDAVLDVLQSPEAKTLGPASPSFWYIARAVNEFVLAYSQLPLPGSIPDMKAKSADYIALQTIYKSKARQDVQHVTNTVRALEQQFQRSTQHTIPASEIEAFCKSASSIRLVRGRFSAVDRIQAPTDWDAESAKTALNVAVSGLSPAPFATWISFLGYNVFVSTHNADGLGADPKVPGLRDQDVADDARKLADTAFTILDSVIKAAGGFLEDPLYSDIKAMMEVTCQELARSAGAELHNIASLTGGMVAQEAIKVITKQYVPVDNVCIYDGIHSKIDAIRL